MLDPESGKEMLIDPRPEKFMLVDRDSQVKGRFRIHRIGRISA
jgi:hypothetical protein